MWNEFDFQGNQPTGIVSTRDDQSSSEERGITLQFFTFAHSNGTTNNVPFYHLLFNEELLLPAKRGQASKLHSGIGV